MLEDCCALRANVHYHLALFAVCVGKSTQASVALVHSVPKLWPHGCLRVDWRQQWKWENRRTYRCQCPSCEDGCVFFFLCLLISNEFACCPFWRVPHASPSCLVTMGSYAQHVKLFSIKKAHVNMFRPYAVRFCVAEGLSAKHKVSDGHATGVAPNSSAEPWACARWT